MTIPSPQDDRRVQRLYRDFLDLPWHLQADLRALVNFHLDPQVAELADYQDALDRQLSVMPHLHRAADELGITRDQPMTVSMYRSVAGPLGLMSEWSVIRAFKSWRQADAARRGDRVRASVAQLERRRIAKGKRRNQEDYLAGLQLFLRRPNPTVNDKPAYNAFVRDYNARLAADGRPLVQADSVTLGLSLPWDLCMAVAGGRLTLDRAREMQVSTIREEAGTLELVSVRVISLLLGCSHSYATELTTRVDFPRRAALVNDAPVWVLGDIQAFASGKTLPARIVDELQSLIYDSRQLTAELAFSSGDVLRTALHKDAGAGRRVPAPAGRVAGCHYWLRADVRAWKAESRRRRRTIARRRARMAQ